MEATRIIQRVIDSNYRLAALETRESDRLLAMFKRLTLNTGRAVYHWSPGSGLYRLGVEHIFIPRTRTPADVLAYVAASRHYGIYLLQCFETPLARGSMQRRLEQIADHDDGVRRLVVLFGEDLHVPRSLRPRVATIRHNVRPKQRPDAQTVTPGADID